MRVRGGRVLRPHRHIHTHRYSRGGRGVREGEWGGGGARVLRPHGQVPACHILTPLQLGPGTEKKEGGGRGWGGGGTEEEQGRGNCLFPSPLSPYPKNELTLHLQTNVGEMGKENSWRKICVCARACVRMCECECGR